MPIQFIAVSKGASQRPYCAKDTLEFKVEGSPIQQVNNFTYLGVVISGYGTIDKERSTLIPNASGAFYQLSSIWNSHKIVTVNINKAAILSALLYGSEVWNTT